MNVFRNDDGSLTPANTQGHSPALLVPMITVSAICLALLWLLLPLFVDFSKIGEWVQSTADWGEIHLLMLLGFKPNKLQRLDTLLTRTKSGRSRSFITSRSFANLTTGGDDDDDNTDLASAHNSGRFRRNSARWSTYSAAESMAASRMSTGSWDSARASEMGEMRAIQKVLQRQTARGEAWVRVRGSLKIVIGFYQVCVYERRQEKHTCAYFLSAFLRAKTPWCDQRERSEFPR